MLGLQQGSSSSRLKCQLSYVCRVVRENLMQQRRARVGDIVDDYCPRDQVTTSHAVVSVDETNHAISITRCQKCDSEHTHPGDRVAVGEGEANKRENEGSVRRPLIRATLQYPEGAPVSARQPPVFTMYERQRGGQTRGKSGMRGFSGTENGRSRDVDGNTKKAVGRHGGQAKTFQNGKSTDGKSNFDKKSGDQTRSNGRFSGKSRSSSGRRGRGRSR